METQHIDNWSIELFNSWYDTYTFEETECLCMFKNKKTIIMYLKGKKIYFEYCKNCLM